MTHCLSRSVASAIVLLTAASVASADVKVGDKPALRVHALDGSTIDLADYRGKLVLIDFWVGRSEANLKNERRIKLLYETYHDRGFEIIGICCDAKLEDAKRFVEEMELPWPVHHEPKDWTGPLGQAWGVPRVNWSYLISPDGVVLWVGAPTRAEADILDALEKNPPKLVDEKTLVRAKSDLDAVENALADKDRAGAVSRFARLPKEASKDPDFAKRRAAVEKNVGAAVDELLAEADPMVAAGQWAEASAKLSDVVRVATGTPWEEKARKRLAELVANPAAKAALAQSSKESQATEALAAARKVRDDNQPEAAYTKFKAVAADYPGTAAGKDAADAAAKLEADPAFMQRVRDRAASAKAKAAMSVAESYEKAGRAEQAKQKYRDIVSQFPGTTYAKTAAERLAK